MPITSSGKISFSDFRNQLIINNGTSISLNNIANDNLIKTSLINAKISLSNFYNLDVRIKHIKFGLGKIPILNLISSSPNPIYYYLFADTTATYLMQFITNTNTEILAIGGGGGGGGGYGGSGGGGGNIYYNSSYIFTNNNYNIIIGSGGVGGRAYTRPTSQTSEIPGTGGNSGNITSISLNANNIIIANGGGQSDTGFSSGYFHAANGGNSSANINGIVTNYSGGTGYYNNYSWVSGGGAGAGQNGTSANMSGSTITSYGNGGNGYNSSITGTATYYAGGGAGVPASQFDTPSATNGLGQTTYGGGGRGAWKDIMQGENGKNGCVIIRFTFTWPLTTAVQTSFTGTYSLLPSPVGSTGLEYIAGLSATNSTRTGGSTFNNLNAVTGFGGANSINYQQFIIQAYPGDTIIFQIKNGATYSTDTEVNYLMINYGSGYTLIASNTASGSHTDTINYTVPLNTPFGNYGILAYNCYNTIYNIEYQSAQFYSLHIS